MQTENDIDQLIWDTTHQTPAVDWLAFEDPGQLSEKSNPLDTALCNPVCTAKLFRRDPRDPENPVKPLTAEKYYSLPLHIRASIVWHRLILCRTPLGQTSRQLLTALGLCGLDVAATQFPQLRQSLENIPPLQFLEQCLQLANLSAAGVRVNMLTAPDTTKELPDTIGQTAILPVLGLEETFEDWDTSCEIIKSMGLPIKKNVDKPSAGLLRDHMEKLIREHGIAAMSARLHPSFGSRTRKSPAYKIVQRCLLPLSQQMGIPLLLRPGFVPGATEATHSYTDCEFDWLEPMLREFPHAKVMIVASTPSQADTLYQHSRIHANLTVTAGCCLGSAQTSRLFENLIEQGGVEALPYISCGNSPLLLVGRWAHQRWNMGKLLQKAYAGSLRTGWPLPPEALQEDLQIILNNDGKVPLRPESEGQ